METCLARTHNPTNTEVLPEEHGVQAPYWAPRLGDLPWEDEPPQHLALKMGGLMPGKSLENQASACKGRPHVSLSKSQCRGSGLKSAWVTWEGNLLTEGTARGAGIR